MFDANYFKIDRREARGTMIKVPAIKVSASWQKKVLLSFLIYVACFAAFEILAKQAISAELGSGQTMIVYDLSGSMRQKVDNEAKYRIARESLKVQLSAIARASNVGLVAYGHRSRSSCGDVQLLAEPVAMNANLTDIEQFLANSQPKGRTPIGAALRMAASQLTAGEPDQSIILITDGLESCKDDPCAVVQSLIESGLGFKGHVIAFDMPETEAKESSCIAEATGGTLTVANDRSSLEAGLENVVAQMEQDVTDQTEAPIIKALANKAVEVQQLSGKLLALETELMKERAIHAETLESYRLASESNISLTERLKDTHGLWVSEQNLVIEIQDQHDKIKQQLIERSAALKKAVVQSEDSEAMLAMLSGEVNDLRADQQMLLASKGELGDDLASVSQQRSELVEQLEISEETNVKLKNALSSSEASVDSRALKIEQLVLKNSELAHHLRDANNLLDIMQQDAETATEAVRIDQNRVLEEAKALGKETDALRQVIESQISQNQNLRTKQRISQQKAVLQADQLANLERILNGRNKTVRELKSRLRLTLGGLGRSIEVSERLMGVMFGSEVDLPVFDNELEVFCGDLKRSNNGGYQDPRFLVLLGCE